MKIVKLLLVNFVFTLAVYCTSVEQPVLISLGQDCEPAWYARALNIRKIAFPVDWVISYNFEKLCQALTEKFEHFLNKDYLQYRDSHIENSRYDFRFHHDFPTYAQSAVSHDDGNAGKIQVNYLDFLDQVKAKYAVRIDRFFQVLQGSAPVIFFRTYINPQQAQFFVDLMSTYYPNLSYTLVVIHNNRANDYDWKIPHVTNFYIAQRTINGALWYNKNDWAGIFSRLGLAENAGRVFHEYDNIDIHANCTHCFDDE